MNSQGPGKIEFLTDTCNIVQGCSRNCRDCYVPRDKRRWNPGATREEIMRLHFSERELTAPLNRIEPSRIGLCFTGDLFNDDVPREWIERVLGMCRECLKKRPDHRFVLLTKNPKGYGEFDIPRNCWCGTSISGAYQADLKDERKRVEQLVDYAPQFRSFLSLEPFVGPRTSISFLPWPLQVEWLVIGGLTGKNAKQPNPLDVEDIIAFCRRECIPVFIKDNAKHSETIQKYPAGLLLPHEKTSTGESHE